MVVETSPVAESPTAVVLTDACPWCEQPIPHDKFAALQEKIAEQERARSAAAEKALHAAVQHEREALKRAAEARIEEIERLAAERAAAERAAGKQEAQALAEEGLRAARQEQAAAEAKLSKVQEELERAVASRVNEVRESLLKDKDQAVNEVKAQAFKERQELDEKISSLQRKVQTQTAEQLGEGAELDLFETLKAAFPHDSLKRVGKGTAGADIIHEVVQNNRVCGLIVYDAKNRDAWRNDYVTKLRSDQLAAKADHAILATRAFPAGSRQILVQDHVLIANPARVEVLAGWLRQQILLLDSVRATSEERESKSLLLYDYMTSEACRQLFEQYETITEDLLDLDVKETAAHNRVWRQRGALIKSLQRAQSSMVSGIEQITGAGVMDLPS